MPKIAMLFIAIITWMVGYITAYLRMYQGSERIPPTIHLPVGDNRPSLPPNIRFEDDICQQDELT